MSVSLNGPGLWYATRAAPAGQAGPLHQVDQPLGPQPAGAAPGWQAPVLSLVLAEVGHLVVRHTGQQARQPQRWLTVRGDLQCGHRAPVRTVVTSRQVAAAATAAAQQMVSANTQSVSRSVPMPRPCARPTGQHA